MTRRQKIATVFGGTGFVGRQIVRELAKAGYRVKVPTRVPERAFFLKPCGLPGQIVPVLCDYTSSKSLAEAVSGAEAVVNCIGILFERKKGDFQRLHAELPAAIAKACKKEGVKRFVHISALGVETSKARYGRTKLEGETGLLKVFPEAVILRPSVIFGPDDEFFNMFARIARISPVLPLIGGGKTQFQPVYVGDVADAVLKVLEKRGEGRGKIYELGGPETVSFQEIYEILSAQTGVHCAFVPLPFFLAKISAFFMGLLPRPPLTPDQVKSLKTHSIVTAGRPGFRELGLRPVSMGSVLPGYLSQYRPGGRFSACKAA